MAFGARLCAVIGGAREQCLPQPAIFIEEK
jgi:hypothetical protein